MMYKKHIPNFVTCLNLISGCLSVIMAFNAHLVISAYLIVLASFFDLADGLLARLLNAKSDFGKQLDSLADIVSFGIAPGIIMFQLISKSSGLPALYVLNTNLISYIAIIIPLFSALRLAKFNIDDNQKDSFIGLPTPASAIFIASLPIIIYAQNTSDCILNFIYNPYFLIIITIVLSYLLISPLPLFSFKFKNLKWTENKIRYIFLTISVILFLLFYFIAIPFIIILYIILSITENLIKTKKT